MRQFSAGRFRRRGRGHFRGERNVGARGSVFGRALSPAVGGRAMSNAAAAKGNIAAAEPRKAGRRESDSSPARDFFRSTRSGISAAYLWRDDAEIEAAAVVGWISRVWGKGKIRGLGVWVGYTLRQNR